MHLTKLYALSYKTIVIDANIYLYTFKTDYSNCADVKNCNPLLTNFELLCNILDKYNIVPIFVFDGKPPKEKMDTLKDRSERKRSAKNEYDKLKESVMLETNPNKIKIMKLKMNKLKKAFTRVYKEDVVSVKKYLTERNMKYIKADGEADTICAHYVLTGKAFACLSDDTDMFVYGCSNVMRCLDLSNETCILYNTKNIMNTLNISDAHFKQLCILVGTDYNKKSQHSEINIFEYYTHYLKFMHKNKNLPDSTSTNGNCFFEHMHTIIPHHDIETLNQIREMYDIDHDNVEQYISNYKWNVGSFEVDEIDVGMNTVENINKPMDIPMDMNMSASNVAEDRL
jgi:flap endonuclease-1